MRILFIGAHFDDDFPISAILHRHRLSGDDIYMTWTTLPLDNKLRVKRFLEMRQAMRFAGIPLKKCRVLSYPDRRSYLFAKELFDDLTEIIKKLNPDFIYIPAFEGGNIDHDIVHVLTMKSLQKNKIHASVMEFSLYNSHNRPHIVPPADFCTFIQNSDSKTLRIPLTPEETTYMTRYFKMYASQYFWMRVHMHFFNHRHDFWQFVEIRKVPKYKYLKRPSKNLTYERYQDVHFKDFKKAIGFLYKPSSISQAGIVPSLKNKEMVKTLFLKRHWSENYIKKVTGQLMHL